MSTAIQKRAYELDELSEMGLGSRSHLYDLINAGKLRARKRGRRTVVTLDDLEAHITALPAIEPKSAA